MNPIAKMWKDGNFKPPLITSGINENTREQFIVVDDDSTIIRTMNQNGQIFVVAGFRCSIKTAPDGRKYYLCGNPMHPVTCSKINNPRDKFAVNTIKPIIFP